MVTGGLRPPMQRVGLDEDDAPADVRVPSGPQRLGVVLARLAGWASRRPARAVAAATVTLALVATVGVGAPAWVGALERDRVLGAAAFPGALLELEAAPRPRWSADVDGSVVPVLVGDVVVAVAGQPTAGRRVLGLDVVDGAPRWSVPLDDEPFPETVLCRALHALLACVVGPKPPADRRRAVTAGPDTAAREAEASALLLLDPDDGAVLARHDLAGWAVATAQAGQDLVVATYAWGMLTVRRVDAGTGGVRWETERWSTFMSAGSSRVRLVAAGGLVTATGNEVTLVLDAGTGERLPRPQGSSVSDETRLLEDGTLVRTRYRPSRAGLVSELSTGRGAPWSTVRGAYVQPGAADGTSGLVFAVGGLTGGPLAGRVRAYRPGATESVWRAPVPAHEVVVDAAGLVVLRGAGVLVGLEVATGELLWRRSFPASVRRTFTDGDRVVVEHESVDGRPTVTALALGTGDTEWDALLPAQAPRVLRVGAHLYALGDEELVALR